MLLGELRQRGEGADSWSGNSYDFIDAREVFSAPHSVDAAPLIDFSSFCTHYGVA